MDDKMKQMLQELGAAINESISGNKDVDDAIQRIRDEGYDLYVVLDATIGLNKQDETESREEINVPREVFAPAPTEQSDDDCRFQINVNDLSVLRGLGIDPTLKLKPVVRSRRRITGSGSG